MIDNLEKININQSEQWVWLRGKNIDAPLIILVQAGPGLPMIPEAENMQKLLHLEDDYLLAYWDQRACGKSFDSKIDPKTINFAQLTDDLIVCTEFLLKKYKKEKAILIGYSIGATIGLMAASKNNKLFSDLFLVGIDINISVANKFAIDFAQEKANQSGNKNWIKQAKELNNLQINDAKSFQKRAKLMTNLGGIISNASYNELFFSTVKNMLFCKAYKLLDIAKAVQGMEFCQNALLAEMNLLNLFEKIKNIDVPAHFIQGKKDGVAPYETAKKYFEFLSAKHKTFTDFENSAHLPHLEEPQKFSELIRTKTSKKTDF